MIRIGILAASLLVLVGCSAEHTLPEERVPLFDLEHAPDVLTESGELAPPPSPSGNRHLRGWWPRETERGFRLVPNPAGASIEVVQLAGRPREISLWIEHAEGAAGMPIDVRIGSTVATTVPLASPTKIVLPEATPVGRVAVDLVFPEGSDVQLANTTLSGSLPAGRVDLGRETVRQAGFSRVELTRFVPAGTVVEGTFSPPERALTEQRFELSVETAAGTTSLLSWSAKDRATDLEISAEIPDSGPARFQLTALGEGPPASWRGLSLGFPSSPPPAETASEAVSGAPTPTAPPRLVMIYVLDALRADALGAYGDRSGSSPFIDELARQGVVFTNHQTVAPNTLPSTKAFFTGVTPMLRGNWKLAEGAPTLAEDFREAGFRTAALSGNEFLSEAYGTVRGFEVVDRDALFEDYVAQPDRFNDNAVAVHATALRWLDGLSEDERAFAYLHTIHPHQPYDPPPDLAPPVGESSIDGSSRTMLDIKHVRRRPTAADRERIGALYRAALRYNDRELESFLDDLLERYAPNEIALLITSDHGEELFDHGGVLHGYTLYEEQLDIPLILWAPGRVEPGVVSRATNNVELNRHLRRVAGGEPLIEIVDGLGAPTPSSTGAPEIRFAAASSVNGGLFMASTERRKVIWAPQSGIKWGSGEGAGRSRSVEYVFDLEADPGEQVNLAGTRDLETAWLRTRLMAWIATESAREESGELPTIDAETEARLKALGYLD